VEIRIFKTKELGTWNAFVPSSFSKMGIGTWNAIPFPPRELEFGTNSFFRGTCPALLLTSHNLLEFITKTSHVNSSGNIIVFNPGALTNKTTGGLAPPRPPLFILVGT